MSTAEPRCDFPVACLGAFGVVFAASLLAGPAPARAQSPTDPVERAMLFVERSLEATELYGAGRIEEALSVFEQALADGADLDEDGHVAVSIGDCLARLNRTEDARLAYQAVAVARPELLPGIEHRLIELELAGEVSDALLNRLRTAVAAEPGNPGRAWHLTCALLKRAAALLPEAADTYHLVLQTGMVPQRSMREAGIAAQLQEIRDQLLGLAAKFSRASQDLSASAAIDPETGACPPRMMRSHQTWTVRLADGTQVAFEAHQADADQDGRFLADGTSVELTANQRAMIQQHQNRVNAILLEALTRQATAHERK